MAPSAVLEASRAQDASRQGSKGDFGTPTWAPKSEPRTWVLPSEGLLLAPGAVLEASGAQDASWQGSKGDFGGLLEGKQLIFGMFL